LITGETVANTLMNVSDCYFAICLYQLLRNTSSTYYW